MEGMKCYFKAVEYCKHDYQDFFMELFCKIKMDIENVDKIEEIINESGKKDMSKDDSKILNMIGFTFQIK
jgi:hypothetical protein